jgi:hypothetical protein
LQQIAEAEPVAPVSGLSQIELTILAVAAGAALPEFGFSLWSLQNDAENLGLSKIGISLALRRLMQKQFLEEAWIDQGGDQYKGAAINSKGWDWIDANEENFTLRRPQKDTQKLATTEISGDDSPF